MKRLLHHLLALPLCLLAGLLLTDSERGEPQPPTLDALDYPPTVPRGLSGPQAAYVSLATTE